MKNRIFTRKEGQFIVTCFYYSVHCVIFYLFSLIQRKIYQYDPTQFFFSPLIKFLSPHSIEYHRSINNQNIWLPQILCSETIFQMRATGVNLLIGSLTQFCGHPGPGPRDAHFGPGGRLFHALSMVLLRFLLLLRTADQVLTQSWVQDESQC